MCFPDNLPELIELRSANPTLPVFPIIEKEIGKPVAAHKGFVCCTFGDAYIAEYAEYIIDREKEMIIKGQCFITEEMIRKNYGTQPKWYKAIFVPIVPLEPTEVDNAIRNETGYRSDFRNGESICICDGVSMA